MEEIKKKTVRKSGAVKNNTAGKTPIDQSLFDEYVRRHAYYLWEKKGKPEGDDMSIWLRAEQDVRAKFSVK